MPNVPARSMLAFQGEEGPMRALRLLAAALVLVPLAITAPASAGELTPIPVKTAHRPILVWTPAADRGWFGPGRVAGETMVATGRNKYQVAGPKALPDITGIDPALAPPHKMESGRLWSVEVHFPGRLELVAKIHAALDAHGSQNVAEYFHRV